MKKPNLFKRLLILPAILFYFMLMTLIPINYIITGNWGYNQKWAHLFIKWFENITNLNN